MPDNAAQKPEGITQPENDRKTPQFKKMVEVTVWTNRLDKKLRLRLGDLKSWFNTLEIQLTKVENNLPQGSEELQIIRNLINENDEKYLQVYPELTELCVVAADHVYLLDSLLTEEKNRHTETKRKVADFQQKHSLLENSYTYTLGCFLFSTLRKIKRKLLREKTTLPVQKTSVSRLSEKPLQVVNGSISPAVLENDVTQLAGHNPYAAVNNSDTALSLFDDWNTVFHHNGKRYGSTHPSLTDHLDHLVEVHNLISFKDKTVLEIGSFEGANTKEIVDLGAKNIVGIEANRDSFLKCLVVKNEFSLDNVEFVYGDCNKLLSQPRFRDAKCFDICIASGVLYHMTNPINTIDLLLPCAPVIYIWSQIATDNSPKGEWVTLQDSEQRSYRARRNVYSKQQHWGGVDKSALWLTAPELLRAFEDRGFNIFNAQQGENGSGTYMAFLAKRRSIAQQF